MSKLRVPAALSLLVTFPACGGGGGPAPITLATVATSWHATLADAKPVPSDTLGVVVDATSMTMCDVASSYSDLVLDASGQGTLTQTTTRSNCSDAGASNGTTMQSFSVASTVVAAGTAYTLVATSTSGPARTFNLDCTLAEATLLCKEGATYSFAFEGAGIQTSAEYRRGEYLVESVLGCADCHSGGFHLSGGGYALNASPPPLVAPRLSYAIPSMYYGAFADFENAVRNGVASPSATADVLFSDMPYWAFHNVSAADLAAVYAYLRAAPPTAPILIDVSPRRSTATLPITPIAEAAVPMPSVVNPSTMNGRYLAGVAGACVYCHTPESAPGVPDFTKLFAGGRAYDRDTFHLPANYPTTVYSTNLTPDATGLAGFTQQQIVDVLLNGTDPNGAGVCLPMRAGPGSTHGSITASDANDIAAYLLAIPPIANAIPADCVAP